MRALVLHGPNDFRLERGWPEPSSKPGWAKVRVAYAGICGSDLPRFGSKGSYHYPMVLGHEFSGIVEAPSPDSTKFKEGERVAALPLIPCGKCEGCRQYGPFHCADYQFLGSRDDGGFAEFCLVPEDNLLRLPDDVDLKIGAFIEPLAVALHVVERSGFETGASALVYGAGTIGLLVALWLKTMGAKCVSVVDLREESLGIAELLGLHELVNPKSGGTFPHAEYDFAYEAAGSQHALCDAIGRTRPLGRITVIGRETSDTVLPLPVFERMMRKELDVRTCWGYDLRGKEGVLGDHLEKGRFPVAAMATQEVLLEEAPPLVAKMLERSVFYCKAMIRMESGLR